MNSTLKQPSFSWSTVVGKTNIGKKKYKQVNNYILLKKLGEGSFSKVYLGQDIETQKCYALKRVHLEPLEKTLSGIQQLENEIEIMRKIKHPNIISLKEVIHVTSKSVVYIVIEFADCGNLLTALESNYKFTPEQIQNIFVQIVNGIFFLHQNLIVHQDLKPSNILLKSDGKVLISDFGIGHSFQYAATVVGTPAYQAPEVIDDSEIFDISSGNFFNDTPNSPGQEDVWSLGVTLYELVFHDLPFYGGNVFEIVRSILMTELEPPSACSAVLWNIISKMLTIDPKQRITIPQIMEHPYFTSAPKDIKPFVGLEIIKPPEMVKNSKIKYINGIVIDENYHFPLNSKTQALLVED